MITDQMRRLHMGCGESLTGVISTSNKSRFSVNEKMKIKQQQLLRIARQEKKRS
ncbi:MAG: hypothetical protein OQL20_10050 [Sedimenticola sp.]|nr:hypothetical protein [Sedimenticola sp.]